MEQIPEKAELSKGTLYLYLKNKEELYAPLLSDGCWKNRLQPNRNPSSFSGHVFDLRD